MTDTTRRPASPGAFCCLCGNTNVADLGQVIGICLDADACHRKQAATDDDCAESRMDDGTHTANFYRENGETCGWCHEASEDDS